MDLSRMSSSDFLFHLDQVMGEVRRRLVGQMVDPADLLQRLRDQAPEQPIGLAELARRMGDLQPAGVFGRKLRRPAWRWLRDLGERHRVGRSPRWMWSEVEAARARLKGEQ